MGRPSPEILEAYGLEGAQLARVTEGNINTTYFADVPPDAAIGSRAQHERGHSPTRFVLQRLHPVFGPEVHFDIEAITRRLLQVGVHTPLLVRNLVGDLWTVDGDNRVWRVLTHIPGVVHSRAATPSQCAEAGHLAARFHRALVGLDYQPQGRRSGVHDTARHLAHLREVLESHASHPAFDQIASAADRILEASRRLEPLGPLPPRLVHGDMKLNNFVFAESGEALALIDLDTVGVMTFPLELGDALRSWCNTGREDDTASHFDLEHFRAALGGYWAAEPELLTAPEVEALARAVETIAVELAARFAADALEESYFSWNRGHYETASAHNLDRALGQLSLAHALDAQRSEVERIVRAVFGVPAGQ